MVNRLKKERTEKGMSLQDLASDLIKNNIVNSITATSLARYEKESREPKFEMWQALAKYFNVDVEYLKGNSEDRLGLDLWADETGYSVEQIRQGLKKLEESGRATKDIQRNIGLAIDTLDRSPSGYGDDSAVKYAHQQLRELSTEIQDKYYFDPVKQQRRRDETGDMLIYDNEHRPQDLYYDDVNPNVMKFIAEVLQESERLITVGADTIKLKDKADISDKINLLNDIVGQLQEHIDALSSSRK